MASIIFDQETRQFSVVEDQVNFSEEKKESKGKKALKVAAGVAGAAALGYGAYKGAKYLGAQNAKTQEMIRQAGLKADAKAQANIRSTSDSAIKNILGGRKVMRRGADGKFTGKTNMHLEDLTGAERKQAEAWRKRAHDAKSHAMKVAGITKKGEQATANAKGVISGSLMDLVKKERAKNPALSAKQAMDIVKNEAAAKGIRLYSKFAK